MLVLCNTFFKQQFTEKEFAQKHEVFPKLYKVGNVANERANQIQNKMPPVEIEPRISSELL